MTNDLAIFPAAPALLVAFAVVLAAGPRVIAWLRVLKFGQNINEDAPERHKAKQGTPSMGGVLFVIGVAAAILIAPFFGGSRWHIGIPVLAVFLVFAAHTALGFLDDFLSARRGKSLGLRAREKMGAQFLIAGAFAVWLALSARPYMTTVITVWRGVHIDLGYGYYGLVVLLMVGLSNATNLADGLDGLAGGLAIPVAAGLACTIFIGRPGFGQLPVFAFALIGACMGFLWFNAHPARVFMGDTGSLALGSSFTALGVLGKQEIVLLILCAVFIAEAVSVMIQVGVFQWTKRRTGTGRRVFRMTPLHHHFELAGWPETQVVARFWLLGLAALVLGLMAAPSLSPWIRP